MLDGEMEELTDEIDKPRHHNFVAWLVNQCYPTVACRCMGLHAAFTNISRFITVHVTYIDVCCEEHIDTFHLSVQDSGTRLPYHKNVIVSSLSFPFL